MSNAISRWWRRWREGRRKESYRYARTSCLQYANAACMEAMIQGYPSGVVHCLPDFTTRIPHGFIWVWQDGKQIFWDATNNKQVSKKGLGMISRVTYGPSKGCFEIAPYPKLDPEIFEQLEVKPQDSRELR